MAFTFGFSGDDIEEDLNDGPTASLMSASSGQHATGAAVAFRAQSHKLRDLVGKALIHTWDTRCFLTKMNIFYTTLFVSFTYFPCLPEPNWPIASVIS